MFPTTCMSMHCNAGVCFECVNWHHDSGNKHTAFKELRRKELVYIAIDECAFNVILAALYTEFEGLKALGTNLLSHDVRH